MPHRLAWPLLALTVCSVAGCELGSKSAVPQYYVLQHYTWRQNEAGALYVSGETDLPDGSEIDALVAKPGPVDNAVDRAVLSGSTEEATISQPINDGRFTIGLTHVLLNSCGIQPPCGPFPAGKYLLLLDAKTPRGPVGNAFTTFQDPRYKVHTHGTAGFTGIEIVQELTLRPIRLCLDDKGEPREDACGVR